jgi:hypothetical protein
MLPSPLFLSSLSPDRELSPPQEQSLPHKLSPLCDSVHIKVHLNCFFQELCCIIHWYGRHVDVYKKVEFFQLSVSVMLMQAPIYGTITNVPPLGLQHSILFFLLPFRFSLVSRDATACA